MSCTKCGQQIGDGAQFCTSCGSALTPTKASANRVAAVRPLAITVGTEGHARQYGEYVNQPSQPHLVDAAVTQTIAALRDDILSESIPKETKAIFETNTVGTPKPRVREGTLVECASRYPALSEIYTPVRRYARSGMGYGILFGVILNLVLLGFLVVRRNEAGVAILALPVCYILMWLSISNRVAIPSGLQNICGLAGGLIIPGYLGFNGLFPMLLGAAFSGAVLFSMPGMTVGAIIGAIRRPRIPRAFDAAPEKVVARIAVPFAVGSAVWVAYYFLVREYLPQLLNA